MSRDKELKNKKDWSEEVEYLLQEFNATYLELGWELGCSIPSVIKYEQGGEPSKGMKMRIDQLYSNVKKGVEIKISREQPRQIYPNTPIETGGLIKELRKEKGMTQQYLSESLNVSLNTINRWENAKGYPRIGKFKEVGLVLDVDKGKLMGFEKGWTIEKR